MSDKTEKSKKLKKIIQQQKKQPQQQKKQPEQQKKQVGQGPDEIEDIRIPINLKFLESVNDLLLIANSRISWRPNELIPAGMILKDLEGMIGHYNQQLEQKNNEDKED